MEIKEFAELKRNMAGYLMEDYQTDGLNARKNGGLPKSGERNMR